MRIEPNSYLDTLVRDVMRFGGRIVIREFGAPRDLRMCRPTLTCSLN